jgi:hypothetical protein
MMKRRMKTSLIAAASTLCASILFTSITTACTLTSNKEKSIRFDGMVFKDVKELTIWARNNLKVLGSDSLQQWVINDGFRNLYFDSPDALYNYLRAEKLLQDGNAFLPSNINTLNNDYRYYTDGIFDKINDNFPLSSNPNFITRIFEGANGVPYNTMDEAIKSFLSTHNIFEFDNKFFVNEGSLTQYIRDLEVINGKSKNTGKDLLAELGIKTVGNKYSLISAQNQRSGLFSFDSIDQFKNDNASRNVVRDFVRNNHERQICKQTISSTECMLFSESRLGNIIAEDSTLIDYIDLNQNGGAGVYLLDITDKTPGNLISPYLIESTSGIFTELGNKQWQKQKTFDNSSISSTKYEVIFNLATSLITSSIIGNDHVIERGERFEIDNPLTHLLFNKDLRKLLEIMLNFNILNIENKNSRNSTSSTEYKDVISYEKAKEEFENKHNIDKLMNLTLDEEKETVNFNFVSPDPIFRSKVDKLMGPNGLLTKIERLRNELSTKSIGVRYGNSWNPIGNSTYKDALIEFERNISRGKRYGIFNTIPLLTTLSLNWIVSAQSSAGLPYNSVSILKDAIDAVVEMIELFGKNQFEYGLSETALNFNYRKVYDYTGKNKNLYLNPNFYLNRIIENKDFEGKTNSNVGGQDFFFGIVYLFSINSINAKIVEVIQNLNRLLNSSTVLTYFNDPTQLARINGRQYIKRLSSGRYYIDVDLPKIDLSKVRSSEDIYRQLESYITNFKAITESIKRTLMEKLITAYALNPIIGAAITATSEKIRKGLENASNFSSELGLLQITHKDSSNSAVPIDETSVSLILEERYNNYRLIMSKRPEYIVDSRLDLNIFDFEGSQEVEIDIEEFLSTDYSLNFDYFNLRDDSQNELVYKDISYKEYLKSFTDYLSFNDADLIRQEYISSLEDVDLYTKLLELSKSGYEYSKKIIEVSSKLFDGFSSALSMIRKSYDEGGILRYLKDNVFTELVNSKYVATLKNFSTKLLEKLGDITEKTLKYIEKIRDVLVRGYQSLRNRISSIYENIKSNSELLSRVSAAFQKISRSIASAINKISNSLSKLTKQLSEIAVKVRNGFKKLANGIGKLIKFAGWVGMAISVAIELVNLIVGNEVKESYQMILDSGSTKLVWNGGSYRQHSFFGIDLFTSKNVGVSAIEYAAQYEIKSGVGQKYYYAGNLYNEITDVQRKAVENFLINPERHKLPEAYKLKFVVNNKGTGSGSYQIFGDTLEEIEEKIINDISSTMAPKNTKFDYIQKTVETNVGLFRESGTDSLNSFVKESVIQKITSGSYKPWIYVQLPYYNDQTQKYERADNIVPQHPSTSLEIIDGKFSVSSVYQNGQPLTLSSSKEDIDTFNIYKKLTYLFYKPYYQTKVDANEEIPAGYYSAGLSDQQKYDIIGRSTYDASRKLVNGIRSKVVSNLIRVNRTLWRRESGLSDYDRIPELIYTSKNEKSGINDADNYLSQVYSARTFDGESANFLNEGNAIRWILSKCKFKVVEIDSNQNLYEYKHQLEQDTTKVLSIQEFVNYVVARGR